MYNHYIAVDWAQSNMAIAKMTKDSERIRVMNVPANIKEMQFYLKNLRGKKILTIEETTTSQWLYIELRDYVDEILICDPYRNYLLSEGPKTDELDAIKLVNCPDGPRYKALGNSMAVNVMSWIGERIQIVDEQQWRHHQSGLVRP